MKYRKGELPPMDASEEADDLDIRERQLQEATDLIVDFVTAAELILEGRDELYVGEEVTGEDLRHFLFDKHKQWQNLRAAIDKAVQL